MSEPHLTSCNQRAGLFLGRKGLRLIPDHLGLGPPAPTVRGDRQHEGSPKQTECHLVMGCSTGHETTHLTDIIRIAQRLVPTGQFD